MKNKWSRYLGSLNTPILIEIALGATIAIFIADAMGLQYSAAAGITTLLTIQNTRKETVRSTVQRYVSFVVMLLLVRVILDPLGYTTIGFGLFLLFYVGACFALGVQAVMSSNAVLATHFLAAQHMGFDLIVNEFWILTIGASVGVLLNILIPTQKKPLAQYRDDVEDRLKHILGFFADRIDSLADDVEGDVDKRRQLEAEDREVQAGFDQLRDDLKAYRDAATVDMANRYIGERDYPVQYFEMRTRQAVVLENIWDNLVRVRASYSMNAAFSEYVRDIARSFHEYNNAEKLLDGLQVLEMMYDDAALPQTRAEFKNRALLYVIMQDVRQFLQLKRDFILEVSKHEREKHWR